MPGLPADLLHWLVLAAVAAALVALTFAVVVKPLRVAAHLRRQGVRGKPFVPLLGNLPEIARLRKLQCRLQRRASGPGWVLSGAEGFLRPFEAMLSTGGHADGYYFLGPEVRLMCSDPARAREVLVTHAGAFSKPEIMRRVLGAVLGRGLLLAEGDEWRAHRRLINPSFHFDALAKMVPGMAAVAQHCISALPLSAAPSRLDVHPFISALTLEVIGRAAFGVSVDSREGATSAVYREVSHLLELSVAAVLNMTAFLPGFAAYARWRHATAAASVHKVLDRSIEARRAARSGPTPDARDGPLLIDLLLDAGEDTGDGGRLTLTHDEVRDEAITFILAGHETTAQAICWTMLLLSMHPSWQVRARAAVRDAIGHPRNVTSETLAKVPELAWIIQESMRLYPPAPMVVRCANEPVQLQALSIMAGTTVMIPIAMLHRDPALWTDPDEFQPQRWEGGLASALKHPMAYLPFSAGPRNCIGSQFAMMEARAILAVLLLTIEWDIDADTYVHQPVSMITLRPANGMPMFLKALPHD